MVRKWKLHFLSVFAAVAAFEWKCHLTSPELVVSPLLCLQSSAEDRYGAGGPSLHKQDFQRCSQDGKMLLTE